MVKAENTSVLGRAAHAANGVRQHRVDTAAILPWAIVGIVVGLVIVPLLAMVLMSFRPLNVMPLEWAGGFTLAWYPEVFLDSATYLLLWNTFKYAFATIVLALPVALFFAWLVERTDLPGRDWFYSLMFVPLIMPGFFTAIAWIQLAGPNAGALNVYIRDLLDLAVYRGPLNIFSFWGMVFVTALGVVPPMWLILLSLFRNMDPAMEEASAIAGSSHFSTLRRITLPLLRPGILSVLIYYTLILTEIFEIPVILGLTAGYHVLSVQIFLKTTGGETTEGLPAYGLASTYGIIALLLGAVLIILYLYAVRRQEKFAVVTGKGYRPAIIRLGNWKYLCLGLVGAYMFLKVLLPVLIVAWTSLHGYYQAPSIEGLSTITFDNYRNLWRGPQVAPMLLNSAIVPTASAFITMFLATLIAWMAVRRPSKITGLVNALTFLPLAVPGPVLALGILVLYIRVPLPIYGTLWILILAFTTRYLAFSTRLMHSAQLQIDKSLDEASYTAGASQMSTFFRINLRLLTPAFFNGWIWVFAHAIRDFTVPLFLATGTTVMIANAIYQRNLLGDTEVASTYMMLMFIAIVPIALVSRRSQRQAG